MTPQDIKTDKDLLRLESDNRSFAGYWILLDGPAWVTITAQRKGERATAMVQMPRRTFDAMIRWYTTEQPERDQ